MNSTDLQHIDVDDAALRLEEIVELVESGAVPGFVLCENGEPSALMLPLTENQRE
ncbi:MAG: hypothetical protein ACKVOJ_13135 [Sphingomonadaceae bacterium]